MSFNNEEYAKGIDEMIIKLEQLSELSPEAFQDALRRVCMLLRICAVRAELIVAGKENIMQLYDSGSSCAEEAVSFVRENPNNTTAIYHFYPYAEAEKWTETEREKLDVLEKLLHSFCGRIRLFKISYDMLYRDTDLDIYNYRFFFKVLNEYLENGTAHKYTACYFNVKRFSFVNRRIGRAEGTKLLKRYAADLQALLGEGEYVVRVGGDNFIALFLDEHMPVVQEYLSGTIMEVNKSGLNRISLTARAGYYSITGKCHVAAEVMDKVSDAINIARHIEKVPYVIFDETTVNKFENAKIIEELFPEALKNEEFLVYYQPKVSLDNMQIVGAEALCRWQRDGQMVPPIDFIPILEQSHAVCMLDFYMLEHVCRHIRKWLDEGRKAVKISVNFSRIHLGDIDLTDHILEIINKYNVPHEYIEIELTETTTDVDFAELKKIVNALRSEKINTAVDDFGIGYSSLNLIREIPWNVLKIDKSFLPDMAAGDERYKQKAVMLRHVISMARSLGLECIVEGVETDEHIALVKDNNCSFVQGFYFDKPLPMEVFEQRLEKDEPYK